MSLTAVLNTAVSGLQAAQVGLRTVSDNIANVNTPGYQSQRVTFEDALADSVQRGSGVTAARTQLSLEPTRQDGSNVNLDTETLSNVDTVLRYQFATQAMDGQFSSIRTALRTA